MKQYNVVIFKARPEQVEVVVRGYHDGDVCFACQQPTRSPEDRMEAARQDGQDFGLMLMSVGSQEFRRGLLRVLTV